jgi:ubiquinone/menaquinone biosynthesis C-methylase UbiE
MQTDEYLKLAAVEDRMWYFRALHRHIGRELRRWCSEWSETSAGERGRGDKAQVLDAGCGTGGLMLALRSVVPGAAWTGLDCAPLACELARQRTGCTIVEGSVEALPFGNGTFDALISADVICQIPDGARALAEFERVVRPGGVVVITVPALEWLRSYHDETCETRHRYSARELAAQLRAAKLVPEYVTYRNFTVLPALAVRRKLLPRPNGASDVQLYPRPVEAAFNGLMAIEHAWMSRHLRFPIGSSVFAVARKRG